MGFHHVGQAGLELLSMGDVPTSASQSAGITGMSHCAQPTSYPILHLTSALYTVETAMESLWPRPECSGTILAHCNLHFLCSSDSHASTFQVARITGMHYHTSLIFVFSVEMGFHCVSQADLQFLASCDPPISASQSSGIAGVSHHTWWKTRLENNGGSILAHCSLRLLSSSNSSASASQTESYSVAQTGMQWHDLGSLQPPSLWFKQFLCLSHLTPQLWPCQRTPFREQVHPEPFMPMDMQQYYAFSYLSWKNTAHRLVHNGVSLLLPRLECNGGILTYYNFRLVGSSDSPASASQVAERLQVGLELLTSGDLPVSVSQNAGTTVQSHCAWHPTAFKLIFNSHRRSLCQPGWNAVAQSWLTAALTYEAQVTLIPQPPE
ncbi:hypothetical protein AAY473_010602 [Plecturocebus cupreus]